MTSVRVKICGLTREADVLAAVQCGADALGFVFVPASKRCISAESAGLLCTMVPAFVARVGLFLNQSAAEVQGILDRVPLSLLQFHGDEDADFCRQFGRPYIKSISLKSGQSVRELERGYSDAAGILVDSHEPGGLGGTGQALEWNRISAGERPLILAGGLNPQNVAVAVKLTRPWAVDVSSGVEVSPGIKDAGLIKRFIKEAKQ
ncbi:MAG TPA: phosphoribosylanthranilate isomerase [Xanthomonadales bacterium]|nr:phosphoribosylanthranilate isomerase [Xanthomonadales bacterium]